MAKTLKQKIADIQKEIGKMKKDKTNPFFKSKYFDLTQIQDNLNPLAEKHKVLITQPPSNCDGRPALALVIADLESDEEIREVAIVPDLPDPQKMGASFTYFRRYALSGYFRLDTEDDDGNFASSQAGDASSKKVPYVKVADQEKARVATQKAKDNGEAPF